MFADFKNSFTFGFSKKISIEIAVNLLPHLNYVGIAALPCEHPDLNLLNYKICTEIQLQVYLGKIHNVNGPTSWYGWHNGFKQHMTTKSQQLK